MKHTLINSVSLVAVTAMLSGCDPKNSEKSVKELQQEVVQQHQALSAIAVDTLKEAETTGVPLSSEVEKVLRGEQLPEALPDKPEEMVSDLYAAFGDMDVLGLASSAPSTHNVNLLKVTKEKRKELALKAKLYSEQIKERNKLAQTKLSEAKRDKELLMARLELQRAEEQQRAVLEGVMGAEREEIALRIEVLDEALKGFQNIEDLFREAALQDSKDLYSTSTSQPSTPNTVNKVSSVIDEILAMPTEPTNSYARQFFGDLFDQIGIKPTLEKLGDAESDRAEAELAALATAVAESVLDGDDDELKGPPNGPVPFGGSDYFGSPYGLTPSPLREGSMFGSPVPYGTSPRGGGLFPVRLGGSSPDPLWEEFGPTTAAAGITLTTQTNRQGLAETYHMFLGWWWVGHSGDPAVSLITGGSSNTAASASTDLVPGSSSTASSAWPRMEWPKVIQAGRDAALAYTTVTGVGLGPNATQEQITAGERISLLTTLGQSEDFRALPDSQQRDVISLAMLTGDHFRGSTTSDADSGAPAITWFDGVNALIRSYPAWSGKVFEDDAAFLRALSSQGISDPKLVSYVKRMKRLVSSAALLEGEARQKFFSTVLMIADAVPGGANDEEFAELVGTVSRQLTEGIDLSTFGIEGSDAEDLQKRLEDVRSDDVPADGGDAMAVALRAAEDRVLAGHKASPSEQATMTALGEWRAQRNLPKGSGPVVTTVSTSNNPAALTQVVRLLPPQGQLDILIAANEATIAAVSRAEANFRPSIEDSSGDREDAAADLTPPSVTARPSIVQQLDQFTKDYQTLTRYGFKKGFFSDDETTPTVHLAALTNLQTEIKNITGAKLNLDEKKFREFPVTLKRNYLAQVCKLNEQEIRLVATADPSDEIAMPALVMSRLTTGVVNNKNKVVVEPVVNVLGYFADAEVSTLSQKAAAAAASVWQKVSKWSDGKVGATPLLLKQLESIDPQAYQAVLLGVAKAFNNYFTFMRQEALNQPEKDRRAGLNQAFLEFGEEKESVKFQNEMKQKLTDSLQELIPEENRRQFQITWSDFYGLIKAHKDNFISGNLSVVVNALTDLVKRSYTNAGGRKTIVSDIYNGDVVVSDIYNGDVVDAGSRKRFLAPSVKKKDLPISGDYLELVELFPITMKGDRVQLLLDVEAKIKETIINLLKEHPSTAMFFANSTAAASAASSKVEVELMAKTLSNTNLGSLSDSVSMRQARLGKMGVDARSLSLNGVSGDRVDLEMPLFVELKGDITSAKTTDALTGSVAYRLGNTVIGAIQAYANSGAGFGIEGRQLETSMLVSHNVGAFFIEGQLGTVSADQVHISDWSGMRAQVTLGVDTQFVSPFVQVTHRQLDRNEMFSLNETAAYVGLDMDIAALKTEAYTLNTRLLTKVGYGALNWSEGSKFLGSTTGFSGSVEWSSALNLNSGISFSTHLNLDTTSKVSTGLQVSVER